MMEKFDHLVSAELAVLACAGTDNRPTHELVTYRVLRFHETLFTVERGKRGSFLKQFADWDDYQRQRPHDTHAFYRDGRMIAGGSSRSMLMMLLQAFPGSEIVRADLDEYERDFREARELLHAATGEEESSHG